MDMLVIHGAFLVSCDAHEGNKILNWGREICGEDCGKWGTLARTGFSLV